MTVKSYVDEPLVGSVDENGEPTDWANYDVQEIYCGTCRCKANKDATAAKACDCRCHDSWKRYAGLTGIGA